MNMFNIYNSVDGNEYNRFVNLDGAEYRIVHRLAKSESKYADYLWKILAYDNEDCLLRPSLSYAERMKLLYTNNGEASNKRVFMSPYVDDAWDYQTSHLHVYVQSVVPQNHLTSVVNIGIECIVHNKISNIVGDANELNPLTNPSEVDELGNPIIRYKARATVMLKSILAELNGGFVDGVGTLQFNSKLYGENAAKLTLWNGRKFFGHQIIMSTLMSGASATSMCGM